MQTFMMTYYGEKQPKSKEECATHMQKWKEWVGELGDRVINPGTPLSHSKLVTKNGVEDGENSGSMMCFVIIKAEDLDQAVGIAQTHPCLLGMGGSVRVSQIMEACT